MISPYNSPTNISNVIASAGSRLSHIMGGDTLQDRGSRSAIAQINNVVDTIGNISDMISTSMGFRSPMYTIGMSDAPIKTGVNIVDSVLSTANNIIRAVSSNKNPQTRGVIIDGIGDANGEITVELPKVALLYRSGEIIDNRVRNPNTLTMTVMISNYLDDNLLGAASRLFNGVAGLGTQIYNSIANGGNTRSEEALYKLKWIQENGEPFRIYTPHGIYDNMVIAKVKPKTNDKTMDMLYADIDFTEVLLYSPLGGLHKQPSRVSIYDATPGWNNIKSWFGK